MFKIIVFLSIFLCLREAEAQVLKGLTLQSYPYGELSGREPMGFVVDLIKEMAEISRFNYTLEIPPNSVYGIPYNGTINGILGEVAYDRADFAIADITVTETRKQFVDFTEPFFETGIAILIHKNYSNTITSFSDLADQTDIEYGWVRTGSTNRFFANRNFTTMGQSITGQKMYRHLQNNPEYYVSSTRLGVEGVQSGAYAFITERSTIEYITGFRCDLTYIADEDFDDPHHFAIAVPKNASHLAQFNSAIRELRSNGMINVLINKYWKKCGSLRGAIVRGWPETNLGNGKIEGFAVDIMNEISTIGGFNYSLYFSDHIILEVNNGNADFNIGDAILENYVNIFNVEITEPLFETGFVALIHKNFTDNITSFEDLTHQSYIKFGIQLLANSLTPFQNTTHPTIQEVYRQMIANPEVFINKTLEGFERVKTSPYAFIIERNHGLSLISRERDLTYIEGPPDYKPFKAVINLKKDSPHLQTFNSAINQLKSNGVIERLRTKYWKTCEQ